jgi:hypothetical protein
VLVFELLKIGYLISAGTRGDLDALFAAASSWSQKKDKKGIWDEAVMQELLKLLTGCSKK